MKLFLIYTGADNAISQRYFAQVYIILFNKHYNKNIYTYKYSFITNNENISIYNFKYYLNVQSETHVTPLILTTYFLKHRNCLTLVSSICCLYNLYVLEI